jgi:hypothetical protein
VQGGHDRDIRPSPTYCIYPHDQQKLFNHCVGSTRASPTTPLCTHKCTRKGSPSDRVGHTDQAYSWVDHTSRGRKILQRHEGTTGDFLSDRLQVPKLHHQANEEGAIHRLYHTIMKVHWLEDEPTNSVGGLLAPRFWKDCTCPQVLHGAHATSFVPCNAKIQCTIDYFLLCLCQPILHCMHHQFCTTHKDL